MSRTSVSFDTIWPIPSLPTFFMSLLCSCGLKMTSYNLDYAYIKKVHRAFFFGIETLVVVLFTLWFFFCSSWWQNRSVQVEEVELVNKS